MANNNSHRTERDIQQKDIVWQSAFVQRCSKRRSERTYSNTVLNNKRLSMPKNRMHVRHATSITTTASAAQRGNGNNNGRKRIFMVVDRPRPSSPADSWHERRTPFKIKSSFNWKNCKTIGFDHHHHHHRHVALGFALCGNKRTATTCRTHFRRTLCVTCQYRVPMWAKFEYFCWIIETLQRPFRNEIHFSSFGWEYADEMVGEKMVQTQMNCSYWPITGFCTMFISSRIKLRFTSGTKKYAVCPSTFAFFVVEYC